MKLRKSLPMFGLLVTLAVSASTADTLAEGMSRHVLAFYYGWYGTPATTGGWVHWTGVDPANERISNSAHFPALGAYDSHDPTILNRQAAEARAGGITGFIASWWGRGTFEDRGVPILLAAAAAHQLSVSAYYEMISGADAASRIRNAIDDLDYLLAHYGSDKAWLRVGGKPVVFIYGRALTTLSPDQWRQVIAQIRNDNVKGALFIADTLDPAWLSVFDGASTYNITGDTQRRTPSETLSWARATYPRNVAAARNAGKIATLTVIPGYDDRATDRPSPRPVTDRWGGDTYRSLWQEAINAAPDWVLITSWNEWHEGSEIEPSVEYGSLFLEETATAAREFKAHRK